VLARGSFICKMQQILKLKLQPPGKAGILSKPGVVVQTCHNFSFFSLVYFFSLFLFSFLFLLPLFLHLLYFPYFIHLFHLYTLTKNSSFTPESTYTATFTPWDNSRHPQYSKGSVIMVNTTYLHGQTQILNTITTQ
jgi:hypothetical protein